MSEEKPPEWTPKDEMTTDELMQELIKRSTYNRKQMSIEELASEMLSRPDFDCRTIIAIASTYCDSRGASYVMSIEDNSSARIGMYGSATQVGGHFNYLCEYQTQRFNPSLFRRKKRKP